MNLLKLIMGPNTYKLGNNRLKVETSVCTAPEVPFTHIPSLKLFIQSVKYTVMILTLV